LLFEYTYFWADFRRKKFGDEFGYQRRLGGPHFRLGTEPSLGLWVLELFAMYATDGQAEGWTDKSNAYCPFPYGRGYNNVTNTEIKPAVVISTLIVMCLHHSNCILHCCRSYSSHQKAARTAKHLTRVTISWCVLGWRIVRNFAYSVAGKTEVTLIA